MGNTGFPARPAHANRGWAFFLIGALAAAGILGAACGTSGSGGSSFNGGNGDSSAVVPTDSGTNFGFDGSLLTDGGIQSLSIQPANETIDVPPTTSVPFLAYANGSSTSTVAAAWSIDAPQIGSIDQTGVFTPNGTSGGIVNVYAQFGGQVATTTLRVRVHLTDLPSGLDGGVLTALQAGGTADSNFQWLYPYDQTVWPQGIAPPRVQFSGTQVQWFLVTASASNFSYEGVFEPTNTDQIPGNPPQLDLPEDAWTAITSSGGKSDPVTINVTKLDVSNGVTGPISETWVVAQGTLKGIVYYNSYDSPLAEGDAGDQNDQGAVMRLRPGASAPEVFIGGAAKGSCTVCHTLSANGSTMALAAGHAYDAVYSVSADASSPIGPLSTQPDGTYSFGALTPDGKYLLSCGSTGLDAGTDDGGPVSIADYGPNVVSMTHELDSRLFATADGGVVGAIAGIQKALMPSFSPDGTKLVFNRYEYGQDQRLSVVPFDESTLTFGTFADVFVDPGYYLSWPSFLPDSQGFVFETSDSSDDYASYDPDTYDDADGELLQYIASENDVHHLRATDGQENVTFPDGGTQDTYLRNPDGTLAEQDPYKNYEPTVLPVAAGGYYWVVFTSRRSYGNTIDNSVPNDTPPNVKPKKLWVAAIDINASPTADISHPAFYLPGQELGAGNLRGFWTLPPCQGNGTSCQSGTDCCNGFCRSVLPDGGVPHGTGEDGGNPAVCIAPPSGCSNIDEKCTTVAQCCGGPSSGVVCIDGFCALPTPK